MLRTLVTVAAALLAMGASPLAAQDVPPPAARGAFFALSVADVDSSTAWYRDHLGFRVLRSGAAPNGIARFAPLESGGSIIEIIQHRDGRPRAEAAPAVTAPHQLHGIFKVGLHVADIDALYARLRAGGVAIEYDLMPARDVPLRSFSVRDPTGTWCSFSAPDPALRPG